MAGVGAGPRSVGGSASVAGDWTDTAGRRLEGYETLPGGREQYAALPALSTERGPL